ncbi:hypothetical protein CYMTET_24330 [Cymbomonas tetramitiformis]|uniref:Glucosylceramidase n=1 Tax=Cymbomonas tetramitiformis TaxID=36881 RepID=A0AAE0FWB1_9CHLO|nr:hypothetical protein CYMTET_24330 [Cymbomonas tetramitiformis]
MKHYLSRTSGALITFQVLLACAKTQQTGQDLHKPGVWVDRHAEFISSLQIPAAAWVHAIGEPAEDAAKRPAPRTRVIDDGEFGGVPVGSFGTGSFTRTYRGDFFRWHLRVGHHLAKSIPSCLFACRVQADGEATTVTALTAVPAGNGREMIPPGARRLPPGGDGGTYHALFPRAWWTYRPHALAAEPRILLSQKQISPVVPESFTTDGMWEVSQPVGVWEFTAENPASSSPSESNASAQVSLLFAWADLLAEGIWPDAPAGSVVSSCQDAEDGSVTAVISTIRAEEHPGDASDDWHGSFAITAKPGPGLGITCRSGLRADETAGWDDFAADGILGNARRRENEARGGGNGAAIAVDLNLRPGERRAVAFALAWDFPVIKFGATRSSRALWLKRHTRYYGQSGNSAVRIAAEALKRYQDWDRTISAWQSGVLDEGEADASATQDRQSDSCTAEAASPSGEVHEAAQPRDPAYTRPHWYKRALFNELYYLVDGGTLWGQPMGSNAGRQHFALLECFDYKYYNTLDVHYYGSWPLVLLWPSLEKLIVEDYADAVLQEDLSLQYIMVLRKQAPRTLQGAAVHDVGSPHAAPFSRLNGFAFLDPNVWRDLNCKFVLMAYRLHVVAEAGGEDKRLLRRVWPAVHAALHYLKELDLNGDGLPEHHPEGSDQTYDHWGMRGDTSAYCGSLWLAALQAAVAMGRSIESDAEADEFERWLAVATKSFEAILWTGVYYKFDASGRKPVSDAIMADGLAGIWHETARPPGVSP